MAGLVLSALSLKFLSNPFVWIGWGWTSTLFGGAWYLKRGSVRVVMFNAAALIALLAVAETYLTLHAAGHPTYSDEYFIGDDVLGFVPVKSVRAHSRKVNHGKIEFDVTYTIDSKGLRIAPPANAAGLEGAVLFFGCSFTYGEGLQDEETMPYQVGLQSDGRYQTYNFGFHGYAPNQMLAEIESGRVRDAVDALPRYAIYQALPDHVARIAGKIPYGKHGPRYQLNTDGSVLFTGHFDDGQEPPSAFTRRLRGQLQKSAIYRRLEDFRPRTNENDVRLLLAIVGRSRDLLIAQYPGIKFEVILWRNFPYEQELYEELQAGFVRMNIPVHRVGDILPDYSTNPEKYWLSREDAHPNALANRLIANYAVTKILSPNGSVFSRK